MRRGDKGGESGKGSRAGRGERDSMIGKECESTYSAAFYSPV